MKKSLLLIVFFCAAHWLWGQGGPCFQGIKMESVTIGNSTCGNKTGFIKIQMVGPETAFTYTWTPNVSDSTSAFDLASGPYRLRIVRSSEPNCVIDTILIVNNADGPEFFLDSLIAPNCKATDGSLILSPASGVNYVWSNGKTGHINSSLAAGCHIVTGSNPSTGCSATYRFCLPATNRLKTTYQVVKPAKCGQPTGEAQLIISGGYGSYTFSCSGSALMTGLPKGNSSCIITDDITTCKDTVTVSIPEGFPEADVSANIGSVKCPGGSDGFLFATVTPGQYFSWPPSFALFDANSNPLPSLAGLPTGFYTLVVADADGCALPPYSFFLPEPKPIQVSSSIVPASCVQGGNIDLSISGGNGNGPYFVDWKDLPGEQNGTDRSNLQPGLYSATIYDTLFCAVPLDTLTVPSTCNLSQYLHRAVAVNKTDTFCIDPPVGLSPADLLFLLEGGGTAGTSAYGAWALQPNGCLLYTAFNKAGYAVDTICIQAQSSIPGLSRELCFVVSVSAQPIPTGDVFFTVQTGQSITVCGLLPPDFDAVKVHLANNSGLSGTSGGFGTYTVNDTSACLTFLAGQMTGFTIDKICVLVYDVLLQQAYEVCYYPTILPSVDCSKYQYFQDTLAVPNTHCDIPAEACLPIPFQSIFSYAILDNGLAYAGPVMGCQFDTLFGYSLSNVPATGPFTLNSWVVNSQVYGGSFPTLDFLPTLMNQIDAGADWHLVGDLLLGGNSAKQYGPIIMTTPQGVRVLNPGEQVFPRSSTLRLSTGEHQLVFRHITTGCTDTASVKVLCYECPPVVDYPSTIGNDIVWTTEHCDADTVFCTTIPLSLLSDYTITIGGNPPAELFPCGNFIGFRLDTGYHAIHIRQNVSTCEYFTDFYFRCEKVTISDTALLTILVGKNETYCPDTTRIAGPIVSITNDCPQASNGNAAAAIDLGTKCVVLTGNVPGQDTLCLRICNAAGECALTRLVVRVVEEADTLIAVPDRISTLRDYQVELSVLTNDRYTPPIALSIVTPPRFGTATLNPATGKITYIPEAGQCGTDSLLYRISTKDGRSSQAWAFVDVSCDPVLVYNGISPNGDGANDTWTILGIDQYPQSTVRVFNRWGNLVLERQGYDNNTGWDGTWNGQDLPDGPYYYLIELGGAAGKVSGYLQIHR